MELAHFLRKKNGYSEKNPYRTTALFHHLHKRNLVPRASGIMSCFGLIAAVEFQVWMKDKMQLTLLLKYYILKRGGVITLYSTLLAPKEPFGDCLRNYLHLPTPGNSP